jgi:protein phosphatase
LRDGKLRQLTTDHTMREVGLQGRGADHLFQAVGVTPNLAIDLIVDKPRAGDIYLMCSDGLSKMVPDQQIIEILSREQELERAVYGLIERANDNGGRDNVSVVLVKVVDKPVQDLLPERQVSGVGRMPQRRQAAPRSPSDDEATVIGKVELEAPTTVWRKPRAKARQ